MAILTLDFSDLIGGSLLLKGKEVIGLPVINLESGEELGKVSDLLYSGDLQKVEAIKASSEQDLKVYTLPQLSSIGRDAVLLENPINAEPAIGEKFHSWEKLKGLKVIDNQGNQLGIVVDILFDPQGGDIKGLEISEGFIGDLLEGRQIIDKKLLQICSKEMIIVAEGRD